MIKKRLAATLLGFAFTASLFAGFTTKVAKSSVDPSKLAPCTLTYYTIGTPQKDLDIVSAAASKYLKQKINATLKIVQFDWGDYETKMNVKLNSGEKFDLCFTCSWALNYNKNARKGAFMDLTSLMAKYGKDMTKLINPNFIKGNKIDGKLYAVPVNKEIGQQPVFRFNKKYVDKYKIDYKKMTTYESLEPALKKVCAGEKDLITGFRPSSGEELNCDFLVDKVPIVMDFGTKDYKFKNYFTMPQTVKFFNTMRKYYQAGYIRKDAIASLKNDGADETKSGKWLVDTASTQPYADDLWSESYGYPVESTIMRNPVTTNTSVSGSMIAISATSENPERAMMFLNLLNSDSYLRNLINYGIEGTHYIKKDATHIEITQAGKNNYSVPAFSLGNVFLTYLPVGTPTDKWKKFEAFNKSSKNAPTLGFEFDQEPVKNELAALRNVWDEFFGPLKSGAVDPKEYLPKANAKLKSAGIDKVIAEAQRQFNAWKAKNK